MLNFEWDNDVNNLFERLKTNFIFLIITKYAVSVIWHFSSLRLFLNFYWQIPLYSSRGNKYAHSCHVKLHYLITFYLLHFKFSMFFQRHPLQLQIVSSGKSFVTRTFLSSCVANVFVQVMQWIWQRQACPCPSQEGVCGRGSLAPQDRGEHTDLELVRFILWERSWPLLMNKRMDGPQSRSGNLGLIEVAQKLNI